MIKVNKLKCDSTTWPAFTGSTFNRDYNAIKIVLIPDSISLPTTHQRIYVDALSLVFKIYKIGFYFDKTVFLY